MKRWVFRRPFDHRRPRDVIAALLAPLIFRGSITPTGDLTRQVNKGLAGSITPSGSLTLVVKKGLSGSITPTGALVREAKKSLSGSITPTGALVKEAKKNLSGSITPTGALVKEAKKNLAGSITPTGNLVKEAKKNLSGSITPTSNLIKKVKKNLAGSITPTGDLSTASITIAVEAVLTQNLMYIEQVKFSEPYNLTLVGGDDKRLATFLAQRGLKDSDDLIDELKQDFFSKDRDIVLDDDQDIFFGGSGGSGSSLGGGLSGIMDTIYPPRGEVPIGGVVFWPSDAGPIPEFWAVFSAANGRFLVGADGATFVNGATGGSETIPINHTHDPGTLGTDSDAHTHGPGTLDTDNDAHTHGPGTLDTDNDAHTHGSGTLGTDSDAHTHGVGTYTIGAPDSGINMTAGAVTVAAEDHFHSLANSSASDSHSHSVTTGSTASDSHDHAVDAGLTASDSHDHAVDAGLTASDSHSHSVTTGATATALSAVQSILPPFLVGTWIQRVT